MKYRISITSIETQLNSRDEWKRVADSGNPHDGGAIYKYVDHTVEEVERREIYCQEVEHLNLVAIISAVNIPAHEPISVEWPK